MYIPQHSRFDDSLELTWSVSIFRLRIDNSWCSVIYINMNSKLIFHFYFLKTDISLDIEYTDLRFATHVKNTGIEGTMSQMKRDINVQNMLAKNRNLQFLALPHYHKNIPIGMFLFSMRECEENMPLNLTVDLLVIQHDVE